jgi:hypothetical protein
MICESGDAKCTQSPFNPAQHDPVGNIQNHDKVQHIDPHMDSLAVGDNQAKTFIAELLEQQQNHDQTDNTPEKNQGDTTRSPINPSEHVPTLSIQNQNEVPHVDSNAGSFLGNVEVDTAPGDNQAPNSDQNHDLLDNTADNNQVQTNNTSTLTQDSEVETFIDSITATLQEPLLEGVPRTPNTHGHNMTISIPPESSIQRKSTRLAKKAAVNIGKGTIQIAQELLVKKLGDLAGEEDTQNTTDADFDFYAQHFEMPLEKNKMEAIKVLIEHSASMQKKGASQKKGTVQVGLDA